MPLGIADFRKLVALDENNPLSRFALGQALFREADNDDMLNEAAGHLRFSNENDPEHLATFLIFAQVLIKLGLDDEARTVLQVGHKKTVGLEMGQGHDLGPAMEDLLESIE